MKIVFFGTSDYCLPILETLHKNFELALVITRPDKPEGRKKVMTPSATKLWAIENKIPVITPATLKKDTPDRADLEKSLFAYSREKKSSSQSYGLDLAVVADFGLIIPEKIFTFPKHGTLNVHFSKLPDLRGPSPVQFTLLRGDDEAWITIFRLENPPELEIKMDSGPIIFQQPYPILPDDTTQSLYTRLFQEVAKQVPHVIGKYITGSGKLVEQDHQKATFCRFLTKDDGFISEKVLSQAIAGVRLRFEDLPKIQQEAFKTKYSVSSIQYSAKNIFNFFQGVTPWPGVWTIYEDDRKIGNSEQSAKRMKILKCHLEGDQPKAGAPRVQKLVPDLVQFEGKNPIPFLRAKIF